MVQHEYEFNYGEPGLFMEIYVAKKAQFQPLLYEICTCISNAAPSWAHSPLLFLLHGLKSPRFLFVSILELHGHRHSHRCRFLAWPNFCSSIEGCFFLIFAALRSDAFHSLSINALCS